jgi:type III secretion system chaperone SycN
MNAGGGWIHETVLQFGQQVGLPALELGTHGVAQLELQAGGLLAVEPAPETTEVLVYLGRPLGFDGAAVLRNALERAHHAAAQPMPLQVAVRGAGPEALLLALVRVPEREFNLQVLGRAVDVLGRWLDGVRGHG